MSHSKILLCTLAAILGATFFWLFEWRLALTPRSGNLVQQPIPVRISQISKEDNWITNYNLYVVPLNVDSKREYFLLIIENKVDAQEIEKIEKPAWFELSGFANKDSKLLFIVKPSDLQSQSRDIRTLLFDYDGGFLHKKNMEITPYMELSSMKSQDY